MKKLVYLIILFCFFVITGCTKNTPVAIVNGTEISLQDYTNNLDKAIQLVKIQNPQILQQPNVQDIIGKKVLKDMIVNEVILQQAKKNNITATKEEIDQVVAKVKEQLRSDDGNEAQLTTEQKEKAFKEILKKMNLSEEKYLSNVADNIILEKFKRTLISKNLNPVKPEEIKTFFDNVSIIYNNDKNKIEELKKTPARFEEANVVAKQLKSSLAPKVKFDLALIYANKEMSPEQLSQRKSLADSIKEEILNTAKFEDVAQKYSQNKEDKIYFSQMNMSEDTQPLELSSRAFKMNVGQVSDVFEIFKNDSQPNVAQGYFIMKLTEKVAGQKFTYASFEKQLENYINAKRAESILSQATATLLKEADIKILKTFDMDKQKQNSQTEQSNTQEENK